jgi:segregation and condensation protein A
VTETGTVDPAASEIRDAFEVKLEIFEGPLDLLLFLIRKDELDIYDIPIARITREYLALLQQLGKLDLEQASDFILMAATLMKIKSQMMLPREELPGEGEDQVDPRQELVRRLLEYQQFKEIAEWLGLQKRAHGDVFLRRQGAPELSSEGVELRPVSLFDLLRVFKHVLETVPRSLVHQVLGEGASVAVCIDYVLALLERRSRVRFLDLIEGKDRLTMIATFVGLLELLKSQRIRVQQARPFDEIWIEERQPEPGAPLPEELETGEAVTALAGEPGAEPGQEDR